MFHSNHCTLIVIYNEFTYIYANSITSVTVHSLSDWFAYTDCVRFDSTHLEKMWASFESFNVILVSGVPVE